MPGIHCVRNHPLSSPVATSLGRRSCHSAPRSGTEWGRERHRRLACAITGLPLEADVLASDELDGQIITTVLRLTNLGDGPVQALHAFDVQDSQQRLFNMADRVVFPGYAALEQQELASWPTLRWDAAMIDPGASEILLVVFKVAPDSRGLEFAPAPITQEQCRAGGVRSITPTWGKAPGPPQAGRPPSVRPCSSKGRR